MVEDMTATEMLICMTEAFLDHIDSALDRDAEIRIDHWYFKLNDAIDAVYRERAGIPLKSGIGRPRGSLDSYKRTKKPRNKLSGKYPFK